MSVPKFSNVPHSFHAELKRRITQYFEEAGKPTTGNYSLFVKAIILMVGFIFIYIHLVFFTPGAFLAIIECLVLGALTSAIGFNIMHDGGHGSFSRYKWVNDLAALSLNFLGANVNNWRLIPAFSSRRRGRALDRSSTLMLTNELSSSVFLLL